MRISDWSSDVCSSDLTRPNAASTPKSRRWTTIRRTIRRSDKPRHCEPFDCLAGAQDKLARCASEAIQSGLRYSGLLRCARNDGVGGYPSLIILERHAIVGEVAELGRLRLDVQPDFAGRAVTRFCDAAFGVAEYPPPFSRPSPAT